MKKLVGFIYFLLLGIPVYSQVNIIGDWAGNVLSDGKNLRVVFHIEEKRGNLTGTMDSPDQGAFGLSLNGVKVNETSVLFDLSLFGIKYEGNIIGTDSLSGFFKQGTYNTTLNLKRSKSPLSRKPNRPQEPKQPFPYKQKEVTFLNPVDFIELSGTLTIPKGKGPFPAVILVSGSGPQNRNEELLNHRPFLVLTDYLSRNGIAVLRYDDRGVGKSKGDFSKATTSDFAFDAHAAFNFLRKYRKIDTKKVGIIGHSEGGMIAPMVAAADSQVRFIVLLAAPGIKIDELMLKQTEVNMRFSGLSEEEIMISLELNRKFYDILLEEPDNEKAKAKIEQIVNEHIKSMTSDIALEIRKEIPKLTETMLTPWFRYFIQFNPEHYLRQINCPVLAINGDKDSQVSAVENLQGIRFSVKETNNRNVYTYIMPDLNHLMQHCQTGSVNEYVKIEETFSEEVMNIILNWIKKI